MNILQVKKQPFDQRRVMEEAKFTYSPLRKASEKETKTFRDQEKEAIECLKAWFSTTSY